MKKKIVLIGMMGSGKSTIGKILSKILKLNFIDTDILIEKKCGLKIKEIFDNILTVIIPRHVDRVERIREEITKQYRFSGIEQL